MAEFAPDYFVLVFFSALGALLFVTAYYRFHGLMLFPRRISMALGALLIAAAVTWFFASEYRNLSDTEGGLDGNGQTLLFAAGAALAIIFLLLVSSLRNRSMRSNEDETGLDMLRHSSYWRLITKALRQPWDSWKERTNRHSSG